MTELRYPNESREYRDARDLLLKDEQELIDKVKAVAAKRRNLPTGGRLDFTPESRPDIPTPPQNFRSEFLEKHYLNKE